MRDTLIIAGVLCLIALSFNSFKKLKSFGPSLSLEHSSQGKVRSKRNGGRLARNSHQGDSDEGASVSNYRKVRLERESAESTDVPAETQGLYEASDIWEHQMVEETSCDSESMQL